MDPDKLRALSDFYREEFLRQLDHLRVSGLVTDTNRDVVDRAYERILTGIESVCWRSDFPALAETLLQGFETLTRLSRLDTRRGH